MNDTQVPPAATTPPTETPSTTTTTSATSTTAATSSGTPPITTSAPAPATLSVTGGTVTLASDGTTLSVTSDGTTTTSAVSSVSSIAVTGQSVTIDLATGAITAPISFSGGSLSVVHATGASDWTINGDGTGSVSGGGASISFSNVTKLSAGGTNDTLHGPAADTTWTISGAGSGSVAGTTFSGFENLAGAANNKDTFAVSRGGSVASVDGGDGGWDSLTVVGDAVTSTPTGVHSGTLVIDGTSIRYAGLEPTGITAASVTIGGRDLGGSTEVADKDVLKVSPYSNATD
jgi:hypothetical protein